MVVPRPLHTGTTPANSALGVTRAPQATAVETQEIVVGGLRQRVLLAGEGPPLLLLHGIAGSADEFIDVLPHFGAHFRAIAADAPGHGWSEKPATHRYDMA